MIQLEDVVKCYEKRPVLEIPELRVGLGVTGLLGPNGSGKSTLIKSLMGLVKVESGRGDILGYPWPSQARSIRDVVGYLPEDDCYIAGLQGVEVVQLAGQLSGLLGKEALRRAHEVLDFCDIGQERYRTVETYSTGMRQKLKFAQTLVHDPPLIILDEPTTGLDPTQRDSLLNRVKILSKEFGKTILLSTHILPDVTQVCDSVIILVRGKIRLSASMDELSRPSTPGLRVGLSDGHQAFIDYLRGKGQSVEDVGGQTVYLSNLDPRRASEVWGWAAACGASICNLESARASLEQIFMDAVQES